MLFNHLFNSVLALLPAKLPHCVKVIQKDRITFNASAFSFQKEMLALTVQEGLIRPVKA